jgi:hypothetical protein
MKDEDDGYCFSEMLFFNLEELGDEAWLTGCPLCGLPNCGNHLTSKEQEEIIQIQLNYEKGN